MKLQAVLPLWRSGCLCTPHPALTVKVETSSSPHPSRELSLPLPTPPLALTSARVVRVSPVCAWVLIEQNVRAGWPGQALQGTPPPPQVKKQTAAF